MNGQASILLSTTKLVRMNFSFFLDIFYTQNRCENIFKRNVPYFSWNLSKYHSDYVKYLYCECCRKFAMVNCCCHTKKKVNSFYLMNSCAALVGTAKNGKLCICLIVFRLRKYAYMCVCVLLGNPTDSISYLVWQKPLNINFGFSLWFHIKNENDIALIICIRNIQPKNDKGWNQPKRERQRENENPCTLKKKKKIKRPLPLTVQIIRIIHQNLRINLQIHTLAFALFPATARNKNISDNFQKCGTHFQCSIFNVAVARCLRVLYFFFITNILSFSLCVSLTFLFSFLLVKNDRNITLRFLDIRSYLHWDVRGTKFSVRVKHLKWCVLCWEYQMVLGMLSIQMHETSGSSIRAPENAIS